MRGHIDVQEIDRSPAAARLAYGALNNAGGGFDPTGEIDGWDLVREARTTDDVSVYRATDADGDTWRYLVGTDGTGSDESRWAVRVGETGIALIILC